MSTGTNQRPEVALGNVGTYVNTSVLSEPQLQRAWCLSMTRILWPTIGWDDALRVAHWLYENRTESIP